MNFEYTDIKLEEGQIGISPSGISKFFDYPSSYYKDNFLGEKSFVGNTASFRGTIIHGICECVAKGEDVSKEVIEDFIANIDVEGVDKDLIRSTYQEMATLVVNDYVLRNKASHIEHSMKTNIGDQVMLKGTADRIDGDCVVDFKTTSKKPNIETIPFAYKIQALAYAKLARSQGIEINRLRIVYIVSATKTLPARLFIVNHMITDEDERMLEDTLTLMRETFVLQRKHPEYIPLLYKSMSLKL